MTSTASVGHACVHDAIEDGHDWSVRLFELLQLPALAAASLRVLEVRAGRVIGVRVIDGLDYEAGDVEWALLLRHHASGDESRNHCMFIDLPAELHGDAEFRGWGRRLRAAANVDFVECVSSGLKLALDAAERLEKLVPVSSLPPCTCCTTGAPRAAGASAGCLVDLMGGGLGAAAAARSVSQAAK
jgi:hypothetical protein